MAPPQPAVGKHAASCPPGGGQSSGVRGGCAVSCPPGGGQSSGVRGGCGPEGPFPRARRGPAGFTLLEVLVAVAILSLSLTSLLGSQMASLRATDQARQLSSVAFLAERQLVEIEYELKIDGWGNDDQTFEGDF